MANSPGLNARLIIANYGAEDLEIDVAEQAYRTVQEGGQWRVCGYAQP